MSFDLNELSETIQTVNRKFNVAQEEMSKVIVGQKEVIERLFIALLCDGHVLIEGLPGLAKTMMINTLGKVIDCQCKRIQFTPDLLPADLTGTSIYNPKDGTFSVSKGPIFTNLLLADEINRAPAKVQSALLEVMQERQVTIGGNTFKTEDPYLVLATQNPIEHEGVYPLPEAEIDRFMLKLQMDYPSMEEEKEIINRMGTLGAIPEPQTILHANEIKEVRPLIDRIYIDEKVIEYILSLVFASRNPQEFGVDIEGLVMHGASPRASLALTVASKAYAFLQGRAYVTPHDIKHIGYDVLRHRIRRSYEAESEEISPDDIIDRIFETIPVP